MRAQTQLGRNCHANAAGVSALLGGWRSKLFRCQDGRRNVQHRAGTRGKLVLTIR